MRQDDLDLFRRLEEQLHRPAIRQSSQALERLLATDYVEFGRSGRVYGRAEVVQHLAADGKRPPSSVTASDFALKSLADGVVLLTYRSVRRSAGGEELHTLRSSLWRFAEDRWQLVFHQGTPTTPQG